MDNVLPYDIIKSIFNFFDSILTIRLINMHLNYAFNNKYLEYLNYISVTYWQTITPFVVEQFLTVPSLSDEDDGYVGDMLYSIQNTTRCQTSDKIFMQQIRNKIKLNNCFNYGYPMNDFQITIIYE